MNAQVLLAVGGHADGRGDVADAHLECGAVRDEVRDVLADAVLHVARRRRPQLIEGHINLDRQVDLRDMDEAVAERARQRPVELRDDHAGGVDRVVVHVHPVPSEQYPWASGGVTLTSAASSFTNPRRKRRGTSERNTGTDLRPALVHRLARVRTHEERAVPEVAGHLRAQVRPGAFRVQVDDSNVLQLGRAGDEGVEKDRRGRSGPLQVHLVARADPGDRLIRL